MTKISWTCTKCGMWHSYPSDAHLKVEWLTYDGLAAAASALSALNEMIHQFLPDDMIVRIVSEPMNGLFAVQREADDLRIMRVRAVEFQPFPLFCAACGHDSTYELRHARRKILMDSTEFTA